MLTLTGSAIPTPLQNIPQPPKELYVLTDGADSSSVLSGPLIAIVGTRAVSAYGRHVTQLLASELAKLGIGIVSGLALGVDSIAHEATLTVRGRTIAIVPGGIERIYPRSHEQLARRIISGGGAVLSEHNGTYNPAKHDFLIRNRLVAGLADAVMVTEAADRSGTLNTVGHALEQGKTVFAVPGNITSPTSIGTNQLIKSGAVTVTEPQDVLIEMGWTHLLASNDKPLSYKGSELEMAILAHLKAGIVNGEELAARTGYSYQECNQALTMLEIAGQIKSAGSNSWLLI